MFTWLCCISTNDSAMRDIWKSASFIYRQQTSLNARISFNYWTCWWLWCWCWPTFEWATNERLHITTIRIRSFDILHISAIFIFCDEFAQNRWAFLYVLANSFQAIWIVARYVWQSWVGFWKRSLCCRRWSRSSWRCCLRRNYFWWNFFRLLSLFWKWLRLRLRLLRSIDHWIAATHQWIPSNASRATVPLCGQQIIDDLWISLILAVKIHQRRTLWQHNTNSESIIWCVTLFT